MKILQKKEEPLLNRAEIVAEVEHIDKITPGNTLIKTELAGALNTKEELIVIKHIFTRYGYGISKIFAYAYKTEKDVKLVERPKIKKKKEKKEAPKEAKK